LQAVDESTHIHFVECIPIQIDTNTHDRVEPAILKEPRQRPKLDLVSTLELDDCILNYRFRLRFRPIRSKVTPSYI